MIAVEDVLKEAGFAVSKECCSRPSCFDFAARKGDSLMFIKIQPDIGNVQSKDSQELNAISELLSGAPLLVGERTRERPLEDDTVYSRHTVFVLTPKTFENVMLRKAYPLVQASPGGYYVEIDGETIRRRRQRLGLSVGETANLVGTSRRTIYGYERGMAKASVTVAYNLISTLGVPVAKPLNVFESMKRQRRSCFLTLAKRALANNSLLQRIFKRFGQCRIATVRRAPFDFVISVPESNMQIVGAVASKRETELNKRVDEILSVSSIVQARPVLVTEGQNPSSGDIVCISSKEFSKIRSPEDLIAKIREASLGAIPSHS
jgi:putative transcriptional regulator